MLDSRLSTRLSTAGLVLAATLALAACGGQVNANPVPAPSPEAPSTTPPVTISAAELQVVAAKCSEPHGAVDPYTTVDELVARLAGHWIYCGTGASATELPFRSTPHFLGAELTSDGHLYWLESGAGAELVRASGIQGEAGYEITPPTDAQYNNVSFQITAWYADRSQMDTRATFEMGPRRLALQGIEGYFVAVE